MRTTTPQSAEDIAIALVQAALIRAYAEVGAAAAHRLLDEPVIARIEAAVTRLAFEALDALVAAPSGEIEKARPLMLNELAQFFEAAEKYRRQHSIA